MKSTRMVSVLAAKSKSAPVTCHGGETPKAASNSLSVIPDPVPAQVQLTHSKLKRGPRGESEMKHKKVELVKERGRWSAKSKRDAVLRLLRGEDLDTVSRESKVTAAKLTEW